MSCEKKDENPSCSHSGDLKAESFLKHKFKSHHKRYSNPMRSFESPLSKKGQMLNVTMPKSLEDIENCTDNVLLEKIDNFLTKEIAINEEKIRKLELVKKYSSKSKADDLDCLIQRWRRTAQEALRDLFKKRPECGDFPSMLKQLNINYDVVKYDPDSDSFL